MTPDEDILEREGRAPRMPRIRPPRVELKPRTALAVAIALTLVAGLGVVAMRAPERQTQANAAAPETKVTTLQGSGPFVLYAVQQESRPRVYALDIANAGAQPAFLGEFAGRISDFAGRQGQAAGAVVPMMTVDAAVDQNSVTRLWRFTRARPPELLLTTSDLVAGYAFNAAGDRFAVARRSSHAVSRGFFLWLHGPGRQAAFTQSLRRPGGETARDALRPAGWLPRDQGLLLLPFCDQCDVAAAGLYRYDVARSLVEPYAAPFADPAAVVDVERNGARVFMKEELDPPRCVPSAESSAFSEALGCRRPQRIVVFDTRSRALRELVRSSELPLDVPVGSPSGWVVAYASGRNHEIEWRSTATGRLLGAIDIPAVDFVPVGWIDEERFVALAFGDSIDESRPSQTSLVLVGRGVRPGGGEAEASLSVLATAPDVTYLGWLR